MRRALSFRDVSLTRTLSHSANLQDAEVVYETPATRLLEKRKEMADIDQSLAAQNEEFHLKVESVKNRRNELRRKENLLKESLVKFDKFLRENDGKRTRAVKKAQDERRVRDAKEQEIVQTRALVVELMAKRERQAKAMRSSRSSM